jgi:DNA polymerase I-like protein with 3'-5' exonuclease and polymerase domains
MVSFSQELVARWLPGDPAAVPPPAGAPLLSRLRGALAAAGRLTAALASLTLSQVPSATVRQEMQVAAVLARMEARGLGFDAFRLQTQATAARRRVEELRVAAVALTGDSGISLASNPQVRSQ